MTVGDLKRYLESMPDDMIIVLSSDREGSTHNTLYAIIPSVYTPNDKEVYLYELTLEDKAEGFTEQDLYEGSDGLPALVFYPNK